MDQEKLAGLLETTKDEISKVQSALSVDRKERNKIDSREALRIEELFKFAKERGIGYKQAVEEMTATATDDIQELLSEIPDEITQQLEQLLTQVVPDIKGNMRETIQRRQAVVRGLIHQMVDKNIIHQLKTIDPAELKAELSVPLTVEVLGGKSNATLPPGEAG